MSETEKKANFNETISPTDFVKDHTKARPCIYSHPQSCASCFFELPLITIAQPCDAQPRVYWQATDDVDIFIWINNKGHCTMKVLLAEAGCKSPITDTVLPGQTKLFSSNCLRKFAIECCKCESVKCLGIAKFFVKSSACQ
ncbi:MAG: hypothetical protein H6Q71_1571 [Firmicutes bacterium]|nr:hypothetical protein [Bacillota bacterium]